MCPCTRTHNNNIIVQPAPTLPVYCVHVFAMSEVCCYMMEIHNNTDISDRIAIVIIVEGAQEQRTVVLTST